MKKFSLALAVLVSLPALAAQHEITGSSFGRYDYDKSGDFSANGVSAAVSYRNSLTEVVQLIAGLQGSWYHSSSTSHYADIGLEAGIGYNFGAEELVNSMFVDGTVSMDWINPSSSSRSDYFTKPYYMLAFGKRFAITDTVAYRPSVYAQWVPRDGRDRLSLGVRFLSLSAVF